MNRIYRTLWSVVTQSWQAVPETAKTAGKKSKSSAGGVVASVALGFTLSGVAHAQAPPTPPAINQLPTGGTVARGTATITQTATAQAAAMVVNQSSQRAVVNWNTFNLGSAASINFVQPNAQAVTLNRVNDSNPSQIFGRITANGQVFLSNANGVYFSPTSSVDVGAITATTHSISDDNFMSGRYVFERNGATGKVVNEGNITAALSGYVALLAPEVQNAGVVVASAGTVAMAAGEVVTLTVDGAGSLAGMTTTASAIAALVENKLAVLAPDGQIILSAIALDKLQAGVVKNSGSLEANSLVNKGGKIVLEGDHIVMDRNSKIEAKGRTGGGTVLVGGDWQGSGDMRQATKVTMATGASIDASATDNGDGGKVVLWSDVHNTNSVTQVEGSIKAEAGPNGGNGGQIETSGHYLNVDQIDVSTRSAQGNSGTWLLDPSAVQITSTASTSASETLSNGIYSTTNTSSNSYINIASLTTALSNGNVEVTATDTGGTIYVNSNFDWSSATTLKLSANGSIYGTGNIGILNAGGVLKLNVATTTSTPMYTGIVYGNGSIVKEGAGRFIFANSATYSGTTTISAGYLQVSLNTGIVGTLGSGDVINNGVLEYKNGAAKTISSNITGNGSLIVSSGALTLTGNNSLSEFELNGGTLFLGSANAIGTTGNIKFTGGTLGYSQANTTDYSSRFVATNQTIKIDTGGQTVTAATALNQGTGYLYKYGAGTLILTADNLFTGQVTIYEGTLQLGSNTSTGNLSSAGSAVNINSGATLELSLNGSYTFISQARAISGSSGTIIFNTYSSSDTITYSGNYGITDAVALVKNGPGKLLLDTNNPGATVTGSTTINGGILQVGNSNSNGRLGSGLITNNGVLQFNRNNSTTSPFIVSGNITGSGDLINIGTGYVSLAGANDYTGKTIINNGYFRQSNASALGNSTVHTSEIKFGGGGLQFDAAGLTDYSALFSQAVNQLYKFDTNAQTVTLSSNLVSLGGSLTKTGTGSLILAGNNTYGGGTSVSQGYLTAGSVSAFGAGTISVTGFATLDLNGKTMTSAPSLTLNGTGVGGTSGALMNSSTTPASYAGLVTLGAAASIVGETGTIALTNVGTITGAYGLTLGGAAGGSIDSIIGTSTGTVTKTGAGTWILNGANSFTGAVTVSAGALRAANTTALGTTAGGVTVASGATLELGGPASPGGIAVGAEALTVADGGAIHNVAGYNTYAGAMTLSGNATVTIDTGTTLNFTATGAAISVAAGKRLTFNTYGDLTIAKALTGGANSSYLKVGGGTLTLGAGSTLPAAIGVYASLFDPTGTDYSSEYGGPFDYTVAFYNAATGGTKLNLTAGTDFSGTAVWTGAPSLTSNANITYSMSYASGVTLSNSLYVLMGARTNPVNWTITPKAVTVTMAAPVTTYTYDKSLTYESIAAGLTTFTTNTPLVGADTIASATSTVSASGIAQAGNFTITPTSVTLGGSALTTNYTITFSPLTVNVAKAPLTVTGTTVANKTYDRSNTATLSGGTLSGTVFSGDTVTLSQSGTFASANAGTWAVTATDTLGGASAGNYILTQPTLSTATISKASATVTANSSNVTYTGVAQSVSGFTASGLVTGDTVAALSGVSATGASATNAGTYANTVSGTATNYDLIFVPGSLVIGKASATVTANSSNVTYTGVTQSVSGFTASGLVHGETTAVLSSVSATGASATNAGTYANTVSGTATNYDITFVPGSLVIGKASATVTASSGTTTYTGLSQSVSGFTATGFVHGETASVLTGVTAGASGTNAGTYTSTASGTDTNYNLTFVNGAFTISKAHLTVTAGNASKTYGDANPTLSATVSGFVNGETLGTSGVSGSGAATTTATALTGAGTATITAGAGTLTASNYDFTNLVNGTLTINKAHLTVTADNASRTYGDANPILGTTVSGFVNGQILGTSGVTGAGAATTTADALTGAGTATITAGAGTLAASNYDFTNLVNGTLTINKANAIVTANSSNVTYNGITRTVSGFTVSTLKNGETASVLTGVTTSGGTGTNAGTYPLIAAGDAANYNLTFVDGALTIGKAHLTVTASSDTRTYGAANPTLTATVTGFVNNEVMVSPGPGGSWGGGVLTANTSGVTGAAAVTTTATATTGVGSVATVAAIGTLAATNYDFTFVNGALNITPAPLSVVLGSQTKVYDGTTNASLTSSNFTLTGFVNGEGAAVTQTQGTYNSANVLNASTVTTSLAAGNFAANAGTSLSNYVLPTTASSAGSITPAHLSATGTKTYDGSVNFDGTALTVAGVHGETFATSGTGTMSSKNVQSNQTLSSIAGLNLTGNAGASTDNYMPLSTADTQVSVTPRAVNLNAPSATKTYDSTTLYQASSSDLTVLSNQLVGGDRVTAAEVVYGNKDAGTAKRVILNNVTISDDNGGNNYTVGKVDVTTGVINKAPLTVSVVSDARFVTQSDAVGFAGVVYNGLVGGETAAVLNLGTISRSNSGVGSAGQYTGVLQATNWSSNNYNISYVAGNYTIAGAHTLLVQVPTASTIYGTAATYVPTAQYLDASSNQIVTLTPTVNSNGVWSVNDGVGGQASFNINATGAVLSGAGNVRAGGYNLEAGSLNKTGVNFTNFVLTGGLTVTPKILNNNLGVQAITKVYDGSASISNFGLTFNQPTAGVATNDTVTLLGSGSFDDRHVGTNKTVSLSLGLSGADAANYALASPSLSANIGQVTQLASVTYTGATNGNWSDPNNWAGGALPDRNNVAQVVIPTGKTVVYYSDQVGTIGSTLAVNGAVRFSSSNAFTLANTVSGTGNLEQRGTGMLTVSGSNTNFSGNLDIDAYSATISNAQALGTGHVVANGGHLSVSAGLTLPSLRVDGSVILDTAIKTTGDQTYNGALTFLSSGTAQAPNFVSDTGNVSFESTVSAGLGAMTAQRSLFVSAPNGTVLFNDQVGRMVQGLDYNTQYLTSGVNDTSPYALSVSAQTIKLFGDVTTFDSQTYDGAVRVGTNGTNGHTRLLVSMDPTITFKGTVDDADPTGKVNGLDVRAISLAQIASNAAVPTITFESDVGGVSPLATLRLATGIQNSAAGALVTEVKTDDASRRDVHYKGDIILKGDLTVGDAPLMIAEQLLVPNASQTLTWYTGTPDFRLRLPALGGASTIPTNLQLVQWGQTNNGGSSNGGSSSASTTEDTSEAGRQWEMAHRTHAHAAKVVADNAAIDAMNNPPEHVIADVQVGNESVLPKTPTSQGMYVQVREFAPETLDAQKPFIYQLPADTFVHSSEKERIKLSATTGNGANLPRWVKFSAKDRTLSGKPPKWVKSLDVKVMATDRQGARATTRVRLVFANGSGS